MQGMYHYWEIRRDGSIMEHKHHWECTDTPGIFICYAEGQTGYFNSLTRQIVEDVA